MNLLGWVCKMEIINYNTENGVLSVRYNTKNIWEYFPVDEDTFYGIMTVKSSEAEVKRILRKLSIIGENKGVI